MYVYKGIPYARPPVGDARWQPPGSATPWADPVLAADTFAPACVQLRNTSGFVWRRGEFAVSEDCLYLNIWVKPEATELPVMVWFHGGAHESGQGDAEIFNGAALAQRDVVLVTINYRLGPFGFLAHPWLAAESPQNAAGNYGLLDKIAALNWVRDNIAQFGGDPENVTIFGQSAGSQSVCALQASPMAEGLFHKAIGQSASCLGLPTQDTDGRDRGQALVKNLTVSNVDELRLVPAAELLTAATETGWGQASRITVDGWVLPERPELTFTRGDHHQMPLLLGSLANEGIELLPRNDALTDAELMQYLQAGFGNQANALLEAYADERMQSPGHVQHAVATDLFMAFGMRRWAEYSVGLDAPTYLYFMDHAPPAFQLYTPETPELVLADGPRSAGAYHSGDLALVFDNTHRVGLHWNADDHALADLMADYWTTFAHTGNPNHAGAPQWGRFERRNMTTLRLNPDASSEAGIRRAKLDLMAEAYPLESD